MGLEVKIGFVEVVLNPWFNVDVDSGKMLMIFFSELLGFH
jgi:hypothetical protein